MINKIKQEIKKTFNKNEKGQFIDENGNPLKNRTIPFIIGLIIFIILCASAFVYHIKKNVATQRANYYIIQNDYFCEIHRKNLIYAFLRGKNENSQFVKIIFEKANNAHCLIKHGTIGIRIERKL